MVSADTESPSRPLTKPPLAGGFLLFAARFHPVPSEHEGQAHPNTVSRLRIHPWREPRVLAKNACSLKHIDAQPQAVFLPLRGQLEAVPRRQAHPPHVQAQPQLDTGQRCHGDRWCSDAAACSREQTDLKIDRFDAMQQVEATGDPPRPVVAGDGLSLDARMEAHQIGPSTEGEPRGRTGVGSIGMHPTDCGIEDKVLFGRRNGDERELGSQQNRHETSAHTSETSSPDVDTRESEKQTFWGFQTIAHHLYHTIYLNPLCVVQLCGTVWA